MLDQTTLDQQALAESSVILRSDGSRLISHPAHPYGISQETPNGPYTSFMAVDFHPERTPEFQSLQALLDFLAAR